MAYPGVLAGFGIVIRLQVRGVSLKMDRYTLVVQHFTGQDQVFGVLLDTFDTTGVLNTSHCDKGERLLADAQVILVRLSSIL